MNGARSLAELQLKIYWDGGAGGGVDEEVNKAYLS